MTSVDSAQILLGPVGGLLQSFPGRMSSLSMENTPTSSHWMDRFKWKPSPETVSFTIRWFPANFQWFSLKPILGNKNKVRAANFEYQTQIVEIMWVRIKKEHMAEKPWYGTSNGWGFLTFSTNKFWWISWKFGPGISYTQMRWFLEDAFLVGILLYVANHWVFNELHERSKKLEIVCDVRNFAQLLWASYRVLYVYFIPLCHIRKSWI